MSDTFHIRVKSQPVHLFNTPCGLKVLIKKGLIKKYIRVLARPYLMTLQVIFPIHLNFPIRSRCVLKPIIYTKKPADRFRVT